MVGRESWGHESYSHVRVRSGGHCPHGTSSPLGHGACPSVPLDRWDTVPVPLSHLSLCPTPPPCSFGFDGAGTVSGYKGRCYAPGTPGLSEGCVEHLINRILFPVDPCSFFGQEAKIESLRRLTGFAEEKTLSQSSSWASITGCGHIPPQFH